MFRIVSLSLVLLVMACNHNDKKKRVYDTLPGYDLSNPVVIKLRTYLDEISGIVFYAKDTSLFAINDEQGVLYKIYLRKEIKVKNWKFADDADYEDLCLLDSTFYVLQSPGNLKIFKIFRSDSIALVETVSPAEGYNNFETMYYDSTWRRIIVTCKDCAADDKDMVSAYAFNPADQTFSEEPVFALDIKAVDSALGTRKNKFRPSAAAINPITKDVFFISSESSALAITDNKGQVKKAIKLDRALFKQPEGITFTPAGDMLISNESAEIGPPNVLIFKYKKIE